jgi:hypothetical protein
MNVKKFVGLLLIAAVLFFVITQPNQASHLVGTIVDFLRNAAESVITFVTKVFSG